MNKLKSSVGISGLLQNCVLRAQGSPRRGLFKGLHPLYLSKTFSFAATLLIIVILFFSSCKKQEPFVDPAYIFLKWSAAVKNLNYRDYSECEAFPKDPDVFRELYGEFYYADLIIRNMGTFNEQDIKSDFEGHKFNHRMLYFECKRISRETGKSVANMKGEVEFIKYLDGPKLDRGWLMHNRTIIRLGFGD